MYKHILTAEVFIMVGAKTAAVLGMIKQGKTVKEAMTTVFKPKTVSQPSSSFVGPVYQPSTPTPPPSPAQIYSTSPLPKIGETPTPPPSSSSFVGPVYQPPPVSEPISQTMTKQEFMQETQRTQDVLGTKYQESQKMVENAPARTFNELSNKTLMKFQSQGIKTGFVKSQYLSGYARNLPPSATIEKTPTGYVVHRDVLAEQRAEYQSLGPIQQFGRAFYVGVTQWPSTIYNAFTGKPVKEYSKELISWESGAWEQAKNKDYLGFTASTLTTPAMTDIVLPYVGAYGITKGLGYIGRAGIALSARAGASVGTRILGKTMGYYPYAVGGVFTGMVSSDIVATGVYESKGVLPSGSTARKLLSTGTQFTSAYFGAKIAMTPKVSNIKEPNIIVRTKGIKPKMTTQVNLNQMESTQRFLYAPKTKEMIPLESGPFRSTISTKYMPMEYGGFKNLNPYEFMPYEKPMTKMFSPKTIQYTLENKPRIEFRSIFGKTNEPSIIKPYKFQSTVQKRLYEYQPIVRFEVSPVTGKIFTREVPRRFTSNTRAEASLYFFKELKTPKSLSFESELFTSGSVKPFVFPSYINVNVFKKSLGSISIHNTGFFNVNISRYGEMNVNRLKPSNIEGNIDKVITRSLEGVDVVSLQASREKQLQMPKQDKSLIQRYEQMNKQITKMKPSYETIKPKIVFKMDIKEEGFNKKIMKKQLASFGIGYRFRKWKTPKISDVLKIKGW